jgi:hypothetical protein
MPTSPFSVRTALYLSHWITDVYADLYLAQNKVYKKENRQTIGFFSKVS